MDVRRRARRRGGGSSTTCGRWEGCEELCCKLGRRREAAVERGADGGAEVAAERFERGVRVCEGGSRGQCCHVERVTLDPTEGAVSGAMLGDGAVRERGWSGSPSSASTTAGGAGRRPGGCCRRAGYGCPFKRVERRSGRARRTASTPPRASSRPLPSPASLALAHSAQTAPGSVLDSLAGTADIDLLTDNPPAPTPASRARSVSFSLSLPHVAFTQQRPEIDTYTYPLLLTDRKVRVRETHVYTIMHHQLRAPVNPTHPSTSLVGIRRTSR